MQPDTTVILTSTLDGKPSLGVTVARLLPAERVGLLSRDEWRNDGWWRVKTERGVTTAHEKRMLRL